VRPPNGVEQDVFEESSHKMQVVQVKSAVVSLLGQEEDYLSEIVADEALIRVPREAPN
jgi:hypothetical protein